ncbi:hypothetical protein, partial [Phycicoccus endophyticus]
MSEPTSAHLTPESRAEKGAATGATSRQLSGSVAAVARLAELPGVPDQLEAAREACTRLRWHEGLRRRIPEAAAESRVRGAVASAELEGARMPLAAVREVLTGSATWSPAPDPVERVVRGVLGATLETEHVEGLVLRSPLQALARLHTVASAGAVPDSALGRPRLPGEDCEELPDLGPAPSAAVAAERLRGVVEVLVATPGLPVLLVAAVVHAELVTVRPFVRGNAVVARALDRAVTRAGGLDPTGVAVTEAGHGAEGAAAYVGALAAYGRGDAAGVGLWLGHCA